ncbi:MAG TPA: ribosomal protein S18-alanine N-acetyltransferase [Polyangiaceae bacterium]|nr:ribosomal protein S18-alanine N-acetyltransferase [Polyangiaceae bacterium]
MSTFVVTELEPSDFERVRELAALSGSGFDPAAELERSWAEIWVARRAAGATPLGFVLVWRAADELHVIDLAVEPESRRLGIARLLLEQVMATGRASGAAVVLLEVRQSNQAALALYGALGFIRTSVRRAYYSDNGEDAIMMRLDLAIGDAP